MAKRLTQFGRQILYKRLSWFESIELVGPYIILLGGSLEAILILCPAFHPNAQRFFEKPSILKLEKNLVWS